MILINKMRLFYHIQEEKSITFPPHKNFQNDRKDLKLNCKTQANTVGSQNI